ncbi:hypothetical protein BJX61DRAFT_544583 [Aspergillus egyptiacus]|nr:hypothetical protein BJX61DRAFT_544583 [Aspergillus egyptiacus]
MDSSIGDEPLQPITSLSLYRRLCKGRKNLFSQCDTGPATYFITNPIPHRHSNSWKPIFYRGDNPKYTPTTVAIGRAHRSGMWGTFRVWIGDGVQEVLDNEARRKQRRKLERKNKWRRAFGKEPRPVEVEKEKAVEGKVVLIRMQRTGLSRRVEWELDGVRYRWSGTRMFAPGIVRRIKGLSHSMKLIRISDHALIATFEKGLVGSREYIKTGEPPNKSKTRLGSLKIYHPHDTAEHRIHSPQDNLTSFMAHIDAGMTVPSGDEDQKHLNLDGHHSGNLTEEAIAFTCWIVVEAEHRLRCKIPDLLEEVAENIDGG